MSSAFFPSVTRAWSRKQTFLLPEIGIRAEQGHLALNDMGAEFLTPAQELLVLNDDSFMTLPRFCVHATTMHAWQNIARTTRSLIPGGLRANRAAVHFAVSLPGDTGRIAFWIQNWLQDLQISTFSYGCEKAGQHTVQPTM